MKLLLPSTLVALLVPLLASAVVGQSARFERWEEMFDPTFHFDPDAHTVQGFSVRATAGARAAIASAERALDRGEWAEAAQRLSEIVTAHRAEVLQVAGGRSPGARWVGAAEWALYLLETRLADGVLEGTATPEQRHAVQTAAQWRDLDRLRTLNWELEGLPEGRAAIESLARLLAERGERGPARAAVERALALGSGAGMRALGDRLSADTEIGERVPDLPSRLDLAWSSVLPISELADRSRSAQNPFIGRRKAFEAPFASVIPRVEGSVVYISDSISVRCQDLHSGRVLWHHAGPLERIELEGGRDRWFDFGTYASARRPRAISPYQVLSPAIDGDRLVATVQVGEPVHELDEFEGYPINHPLPRRRLRCLDRHDGSVVWEQEDPALPDQGFAGRYDVAAPAVVDGGIVYTSGSVTEGAINAYVAAFDLATGALLWRTLLCSGQQELTMFNRPFQEHVVSPPLLHDGSLYVSTNLGLVGCVDAWSGRVRWLSAYDPIPRTSAHGVRPDTARDVHWLNQPPFVESDVVFIAPLDSEWLLALDPHTGRRVFDLPSFPRHSRPARHQAVGTGDGRVMVATREGMECYDAATGSVVWSHRPLTAQDVIVGAIRRVDDVLLVPCDRRLLVVDSAQGEVLEKREWPSWGLDVQRVAAVGSALVMCDGQDVYASMDVEAIADVAARAPEDFEQALTLAELALADGRFGESRARFDALVHGSRADLAARARSGREEAALRQARTEDSVETWDRLLRVAGSRSTRFELAPEALAALERHGATKAVARWLGVLSQDDPRRLVDFGPDGPTPVAVLHARSRVDFEDASGQVELLQQLILEHPDVRWNGVPVREEARRRIADLLSQHGRHLYERFELAAASELAEGSSVSDVESRYPNARAVSTTRVEEMRRLLADGRVREVFEESVRISGGDELREIRVEAARQLGEFGYAELLAGHRRPEDVSLPALPSDGDGTVTFDLHERFRVVFRPVTGRPDPELASAALGCLDGAGEMFLLDAASGKMRWAGRALPGGVSSVSAGVDFHVEGDVLVSRGRNVVETLSLDDARTLWSRTLTGQNLDFVVTGGLVVALQSLDGPGFIVEAYGVRSGALAFRLELPECAYAGMQRVGSHLVVLTRGEYARDGRSRDTRLLRLDLAGGAVAASTPVADDLSIVTALDTPPTLFLASRRGTSSRLVSWSPETGERLWERTITPAHITRETLFATGPGRLMLRVSRPLPGTRNRADLITPVDFERGLLAPPAEVPLFSVVNGHAERLAPRVVLADPSEPSHLAILDGPTAEPLYELDFGEELQGYTRVFQGLDGFVLVSETYDPEVSTRLWVVRGRQGAGRYSIPLEDLRRRGRAEVQLVEGAVLVANGGTLRVIRSGRP